MVKLTFFVDKKSEFLKVIAIVNLVIKKIAFPEKSLPVEEINGR